MKIKQMWLNHALRAAVLLAALGGAAPAMAGTFTAKIESILLYEGGQRVYVYPVGGVVAAPACHGANGNYTSFSMTRPMAKQYLGALLAAQLTGKTGTFFTTGTCTDQPTSETLSYIVINT